MIEGILQQTLAWWIAHDPVLLNGQVGEIIDQGFYKIGDGANHFSGLPYKGFASVVRWFSTFYNIGNDTTKLSTLYSPQLLGGAFVQEGDWVEFEFIIIPTSNGNTKTVYLKFGPSPDEVPLQTINVPTSSSVPIIISGKIKCVNYTNGTLQYKIKYESTGIAATIKTGTITGINFKATNTLILQGQGTLSNDIMAEGGEGKICTITRMFLNLQL